MNREKRLAVMLAVLCGVLLLGCTVASQIIYRTMLPEVSVAEAVWDDGFMLPEGALYTGMQGYSVYYIVEKDARFGKKYIVKEVPVTLERKNSGEGTVVVLGIYSMDWVYAADASATLSDGMEVKLR